MPSQPACASRPAHHENKVRRNAQVLAPHQVLMGHVAQPSPCAPVRMDLRAECATAGQRALVDRVLAVLQERLVTDRMLIGTARTPTAGPAPQPALHHIEAAQHHRLMSARARAYSCVVMLRMLCTLCCVRRDTTVTTPSPNMLFQSARILARRLRFQRFTTVAMPPTTSSNAQAVRQVARSPQHA